MPKIFEYLGVLIFFILMNMSQFTFMGNIMD